MTTRTRPMQAPHHISVRRYGTQALLASAALLTLPSLHAQTLVSYDTFSATNINPERWYGEEGKQYGGSRVEAHRSVVNSQLRIEAKGYSDKYGNTGTSTTRNSVVMPKSSLVTAMRATVTMRSHFVGSCAANTSPGAVRARLFGFFFNAGDTGTDGQYNDVYAGIQLSRASNTQDGANVFRVVAFVGICTDDSCINSSTLTSQDMGTTTLNTPVALQLAWDAANDRFTFQRDAETPVNLPYTVSDASTPSYDGKRMEISNQIPHCSATRVSATGAADFDNVRTNSLSAQIQSGRHETAAGVFDESIGRID